jgi:hypothetical protein
MRTANRATLLLAVLIGVPPAHLEASGLEPIRPAVAKLLRQIPGVLGRNQTVVPMAIPPADGTDGPAVDVGTLNDPVRLEQQLRRLLRTERSKLRLTIPNGQARLGDFSVGSNETVAGNLLVLRGEVELSGRVTGNVVALDGDIVLHTGAVVSGDALAIGGRIRDRGGMVLGEQRSLGSAPTEPAAATAGFFRTSLTNFAGLVGVLVTLGLLGFGLVLFAKPNLEMISDTVSHSLFRSFLTGVVAQVLAIPTFGMLITGLVLSVVGILLVPFVVIVVPLLLVAAIVGGFLAVAHAMGETHTRRRMAAGVLIGSANSYRYLCLGLGGIAAVWLAWIIFGWVPVAGTLMFAAAFLATWLLATIGLGACFLSKAGIKPAFAGRYVPPEAMTDEYLWATPQFGVGAVKRPEGLKPPRPRP